MAEEKKIVAFKVVVDTDDLDRSATAAAERVEMLKQKQKELDKTTDSGRIAYQKYNAEIKKAQGDLRKFTELQKKQIVVNESLEGSNEQLRAQLSLVTAQYNALSKEQRENTEEGQKLKQQVSELTATLKENESAVGDNRRNVGNYKESIIEATNELKINSAFTDKNTKANLELSSQMERSARSASAIAGTFALLSNLIGENEEAQAALQKITLAVTAATVLSNLAKEKGAILDTVAFVKTKALTAAQTAYNFAVGTGTTALKVFRAALISTGIGAAIVAIGILIEKLSSFTRNTESAADMQARLNEELEKEKAIAEELAAFREELSNERIRQLEREKDLRAAQGASDVELGKLEIGILEEKLRIVREVQSQTILAAGQQDRYNDAIEEEKDIVNDLAIARIELNKALAEEARIRAELEAQRTTAIKKTQQERVEVETTRSLVLTTGTETDEFFQNLFEKQRKRNEEARESYNTDEQLAALESLAETAAVVSGQVGDAFAASLTEAGLNLEDFTRRLLVLTIDTLQRKLLVAIAEIYFDEIKTKSFAGIATGAALTALVVGFAETAKAALSKPVKFEQGGEFNPFGTDVGGRLHSQGGTKYYGQDGNVIELERGEKMFIANRKTSALIRQIAALNVAMGGKGLSGASSYLQDGGFATRGISESVGGVFNQAQLAAQIVSNLPEFQVSVTEINRVQNRVSAVGNSMRL